MKVQLQGRRLSLCDKLFVQLKLSLTVNVVFPNVTIPTCEYEKYDSLIIALFTLVNIKFDRNEKSSK